jgi:hypothetical protein
MALDKEQIRDLLGSGLSNEIVATAVGCNPSYISQLMSEEEFAAEVVALRSANLTANNKRDRSIDSIEDNIIERLADAVNSGTIYKPRELLQAFAVLNRAVRRGVPAHESLTINNKVVTLSIPTAVVQNFTVNTQGEVVEVEGQTMVTMPAHQLLRKLQSGQLDSGKDGKERDNERYGKVANYLPGSVEFGSNS